jgi:hypothetical protein
MMHRRVECAMPARTKPRDDTIFDNPLLGPAPDGWVLYSNQPGVPVGNKRKISSSSSSSSSMPASADDKLGSSSSSSSSMPASADDKPPALEDFNAPQPASKKAKSAALPQTPPTPETFPEDSPTPEATYSPNSPADDDADIASDVVFHDDDPQRDVTPGAPSSSGNDGGIADASA